MTLKTTSTNKNFDKFPPVAKTLFVPVIARYRESLREARIIYDPYSRKVLEYFSGNLDDVSISKSSQLAIAIRSKIIDEKVRTILEKYPNANIINLGCVKRSQCLGQNRS